MKDLKIFLTNHPHVKTVYFNERGGWVLSPNHAHPIEKTRDEVFNMDDEDDDTVTSSKDAINTIKSLTEENKQLKEKISGGDEEMAKVVDAYGQEKERLEVQIKELTEANAALSKENEKLKKKTSNQ